MNNQFSQSGCPHLYLCQKPAAESSEPAHDAQLELVPAATYVIIAVFFLIHIILLTLAYWIYS